MTTTELYRQLKGDKYIWTIALAMSMISILVVYSATGTLAYRSADGNTEHFLFKHSFLVILSISVAYVCHNIDYKYFSRISRYALLASVPLLLFAWQFGASYNDASRWITIPFINYSFQPSDLAKLALITNMASMLSKRQLSISEFEKALLPMVFWCGIICGLIGLSDWSTATLLFMTCMLLLFIGRVPVKYVGIMLIVGFMAGLFAFTFGQRGGTVSHRLEMYLNGDEDVPFQAEQSYIAIATGGVSGKGAGQSTQRNFLPHPYSDFIFAIIIEEYGMVGAIFVMALYLTLLYRGMVATAKSDGAFGGLLVAGLTFSIVVQAFVHMSVVVGLLPVTGLTLPLLSMGGTSLLFTSMAIGMILSVSRKDGEEVKKPKRRSKPRGNTPRNAPKVPVAEDEVIPEPELKTNTPKEESNPIVAPENFAIQVEPEPPENDDILKMDDLIPPSFDDISFEDDKPEEDNKKGDEDKPTDTFPDPPF